MRRLTKRLPASLSHCNVNMRAIRETILVSVVWRSADAQLSQNNFLQHCWGGFVCRNHVAITSDIALHEHDAADATPGRTAPEEDSAKLFST